MSTDIAQQSDTPDLLTWLDLLHPNKAQVGARQPRIPSAEEYEQIIEEAAGGYFTPDELAERFQTTTEIMGQILEHPAFKQAKLEKMRELDGDDKTTRVRARRAVREAIPDLEVTALVAETHGARIKAVEQLRHIAGLGVYDNNQQGGAGVQPLQINTNLHVHNGEGNEAYVIEAKPEPDGYGDLLE